MLNHHDTLGRFPGGNFRDVENVADGRNSYFGPNTSWMAHTLNYLEQGVVSDQIDFGQDRATRDNQLVQQVRLAVALCPSDGEREERLRTSSEVEHAPTNYVACYGSSTDESGVPHTSKLSRLGATNPDSEPDGVFFLDSQTELRNITDGTSQTLMISECLVGRPDIREMPSTSGHDKCRLGLAPDGAGTLVNGWVRGYSWSWSQMVQAWGFSTLMTPNDQRTDRFECQRWTTNGFYAARSDHPGGVNASRCDGSGGFFQDDIDPLVWQAMGTISRGEIVSDF